MKIIFSWTHNIINCSFEIGQDFTDSSIASKLNGSTDSPLRELQPWQDDDAPEMNIELDGKVILKN